MPFYRIWCTPSLDETDSLCRMNNNTTTFVTAVLTMFAVVVMIYLLFAPEPAGPFDFPERFLGHTDYDAPST